jgi:5-methylcytosine-specific restriction endonuclease McrA
VIDENWSLDRVNIGVPVCDSCIWGSGISKRRKDPARKRETRKRWRDSSNGVAYRLSVSNARRATRLASTADRGAGRELLASRWVLAELLGVPESEIHLDHIVPLSRGGAHADDNLRLLPARLNLIKGNRLDDEVTDREFRAWVFGAPSFE